DMSARSTTVFTKKPTSRSSSTRPRPDTGVPTVRSVCPDQWPSAAWNAASRTMNRVAPNRPATPSRAAYSDAGSGMRSAAPRHVGERRSPVVELAVLVGDGLTLPRREIAVLHRKRDQVGRTPGHAGAVA